MKTKILSIAIAFLALSVNAQIVRPMPKPAAAPVVNLGKSNEFKLNNGLTVIVVENHKLPVVRASLNIDNKPFALGNKKGVDGLLSQMLGTGTTKLNKDDFNKKIEQLGASVYYWDAGGNASSLTKYFNEIFSYFAEGALNPKFTQEEFEAVKSRYIEGLKSNEKSVDAASSRMVQLLTYGKNHPYAEFDTEEKIKKITLADVQAYYDKYYRPDNAYITFVGDISANDAKKLAEKYFGSWKKGNVKIPDLPKVPQVNKTQIDVVNMPNAVQSVVAVTYPVELTKKDADYYAVQIASTILGGDFNSKLNMNLREKHGWTYGARGGVSDSRYIGEFSTNATVRNEVTDSAVVETLKEMKIMTTEKINAEELENVKAKFLGNFVLSLESPETVASQALSKKTNGLSDSFYSDYLKNINKVTIDDVLRVSKKYFRPEQAKVVVTGKAEQIAEGLKKLGYPISFYDAYGNPIADPATTKKQVDANVTVASIAEKYIQAIGGKTAVQKVNAITTEATAKVQGIEVGMEMVQAKGGKIKTEMKMMGQTLQKQVFDGTNGYIEANGQKMDYPKDAKEAAQKQKEIFPELAFANDAELKVTGIENYNDHETYVIAKKDVTYYYSVKTGLKVAEVKTVQEMTIPTAYSDYKEVQGIKLPYTISQTMMGQDIVFNVNNYKINQAKDEDFK